MTEKTLPNEYREEAEKLASLPYSVVVIRHKDSDGNPVFLAVNTELEGCMADGSTSEEAIENLKDARTDYIQVLLLSGEPVPTPSGMEEISKYKSEEIRFTFNYRKSDEKIDEIHPDGKKVLTEYTFKLVPLNT